MNGLERRAKGVLAMLEWQVSDPSAFNGLCIRLSLLLKRLTFVTPFTC